MLGCDGANSLVRSHIGSTMRDLNFEQRWLVVDVATTADLGQWGGVHQLCDPRRAGTFMQIGEVRYRWEFRLLPGETADDFRAISALRPLIAPWLGQVTRRSTRGDPGGGVHLPRQDRRSLAASATPSCSATPRT